LVWFCAVGLLLRLLVPTRAVRLLLLLLLGIGPASATWAVRLLLVTARTLLLLLLPAAARSLM
jgi:hypothetical protein